MNLDDLLTDEPSDELQELSKQLLFELGYPYKKRIKAKDVKRRSNEENNSSASSNWI